MRRTRMAAATGLVTLLAACGGQESAPAPPAAWLAEPLGAARTSELVAGPESTAPRVENPYADDSDALVQGRQIYTSFNCAGCHGAAGGGGIGPPLADDDWIYGGTDANIYASVIQGRPNGMPAFGPMMSGEAVWKLAAYVKSLRQDVETGVSRRE